MAVRLEAKKEMVHFDNLWVIIIDHQMVGLP